MNSDEILQSYLTENDRTMSWYISLEILKSGVGDFEMQYLEGINDL